MSTTIPLPSVTAAGRVPALDGLRTVAIALVVAFHLPFGYGSLDNALVRGGFVGVDVFFVLSGFLITLVLLPGSAADPPRLGRFLGRRITRLLPAFVGLLAAAGLSGLLELEGVGREDLGRQLVWSATEAINWIFAFGDPAPATFVSHTWSLALEWQWYVAWSAVVWIVCRAWNGRDTARFGPRHFLMYAALVGACGVAVWRSALWSTGIAEERLYFAFDTRGLDAFLIGAVLALALQLYGSPRGRAALLWGLAAFAGLVAIVGLAATQPTRDVFWYRDAGLSLLALSAGALVFHAATGTSPLTRSLSLPPVLWLGRISYSVYLWHWPILLLTTEEQTGWSFTTALAARIVLTLVVSAASFYLLEQPFLRRRGRRSPAWVSESLPAEPTGGRSQAGDRPDTEDEPLADRSHAGGQRSSQ